MEQELSFHQANRRGLKSELDALQSSHAASERAMADMNVSLKKLLRSKQEIESRLLEVQESNHVDTTDLELEIADRRLAMEQTERNIKEVRIYLIYFFFIIIGRSNLILETE